MDQLFPFFFFFFNWRALRQFISISRVPQQAEEDAEYGARRIHILFVAMFLNHPIKSAKSVYSIGDRKLSYIFLFSIFSQPLRLKFRKCVTEVGVTALLKWLLTVKRRHLGHISKAFCYWFLRKQSWRWTLKLHQFTGMTGAGFTPVWAEVLKWTVQETMPTESLPFYNIMQWRNKQVCVLFTLINTFFYL